MVSNGAAHCGTVLGPSALSLFQECISDLNARVVSVEDPEEFSRVLSDLRAALRGQFAHLWEWSTMPKKRLRCGFRGEPFSSNEELRGVRVSDQKASGESSNQDGAAATFSLALEVGHRSATIPIAELTYFSA
jgi:hypothetical protein